MSGVGGTGGKECLVGVKLCCVGGSYKWCAGGNDCLSNFGGSWMLCTLGKDCLAGLEDILAAEKSTV
ncbi:hypothetical protein ACHAXN_006488 [Cyclotella atomus]